MCSLLPKMTDLNVLIDDTHDDIVSVNETHIDNTINDFELGIAGYTLPRNDRNRHGGGVALYYRDDIKHKARYDLSMEGFESLRVEISKGINNEPLLICSMYTDRHLHPMSISIRWWKILN